MINHPITDQIGHFAWAFAVIYIATHYSVWWAGALAGLLIALPRELIDQWPINNWYDTVLDTLFFVLAGLIAAVV